MKKTTILTVILFVVAPSASASFEINDNILISGFGSTSWAKSDNETPLLTHNEITNESCFDCDTIFGMQADAYFDALHLSAQVVKRPQDHWSDPELEWIYAGYTYKDVLARVGRLRIPLFLYSEYFYVGHAYTMARPPNEVYGSILGITAYEGFSLTWNMDLDDDKSLSITPFYGLSDEQNIKLNDSTDLELDTDRMYGLNAILSGDNYRWNFSYLNSAYDQRVSVVGVPGYASQSKDNTIELYTIGAEYDFDHTMISTELQKSDRTASWYVSAQYRLNTLTPYLVYGQQYNEVINEKGRVREGESVTAGLRYDVRYNISINGEWQYFHTENNGEGAFVQTPDKPTGQLYTLMVNFVF
ncbi:hypothetical protein [Vibrio renipiscarius]|uniref:Sulfate ABC transporter permease n=1 Tax=Vibrio renipiscarius TaxID=1461322 RepID=A0A0C2NRQ6_9VIBR|nr:hypothetical protein [Vibrio renipiscarius]KII75417.1 sulfate ABC transporter permease [Vibrio renipiscarius]KII78870.1 sulfate ABC transporter permease [Vibrio renipiscarius]